ncbi:DegT/DnrJ/EryC1/StrS family aminotransferase [Fischerella thermalis]|jgi:dTDP-4-amino-4,6-dideoxygalactose transaminase|uniref:Glutamine--scyllo-inositol transaminase n=1 Tax=Fischerella thermalis JSC-11 TaxID=741277 RepID=G6FZY8_9CYAN|nr:DegT/DnrJ/EryC1/StrS family aminotransferase [Fischerella thermalis]PMB08623.1 DegT/DnrJ/EryC1/StrS family aminotransferase [Fischerella thermalis CCMEE 5273]PMB11768.1 DegT/DnrJ/EryC1/StrS family aminotransferase [Fischerella thermalis CCMEE 5328]EHC08570.1 Glutamine--scyllo-inositol transaminase [Fischerella thermalis JSC-11]MBF1988123.1 DegT/DnrJ/EryC1/StrS family aminotransferase [Fischerella thermalis M58_A2018_009]MBF2059242.1 DegT/DnrJ/EryC1/StrS family aminotransferase [Fischerella 
MVQSQNSIPAFDIKQQYASIEAEVSTAVLEVLTSGRYIGGPVVESFEQQFAAYNGVNECVVCNSGTDALYLALRAFNIGADDEVITTPFTFIATSEVINAVGAKPVFVDIDATTFNLDLEQLAAAITPKTKAIIPVHLFGQPVDMTALMSIANTHNLIVIEDCAQSTGATWNSQRVGSIGHIGCFSFYPTKNLGGCGDGGAITTNDPEIAAKLRVLKEHGQKNRYIHEEIGVNSRLDAIQAAILQIKLRYLDVWNQKRQAIAFRYQQFLNQVPGIIPPQELNGGKGVWNQYTIRVLNNKRDWVRNQLQERGVNTMIYYPRPLHLQPVYESLNYQPGQLPVSEQASQEVLSLPMFPELSEEQQDQVIYSLKDCLA